MYFKTPDYSVALNTKVGSSTLSLAVIMAHHPDVWSKIEGGSYPPAMSYLDYRWHRQCPKEQQPSKPVILPVRKPVDRFISACAQVRLADENMDSVIDSLENGTRFERKSGQLINIQRNEHFTHQSRLAIGETHLFVFPDHLDGLATLAGLALPLPVINDSNMRPKPVLNTTQKARVRDYYRDDQQLFNSIESPDTIVTVEVPDDTPEETSQPTIAVSELRLWLLSQEKTTADVAAALSMIANSEKRETLTIIMNYGTEIARNQPGLSEMAVELGISPRELRKAFRKLAI